MKLNVLALSAILAVAVADTTVTATLSPEGQCATSCDRNDTCCIAKCYHVPCPNATQANDTNSCVRACPQGNGSPEESKKFADCEQNCYNSHFFPADGTTPRTTSSDSSATTTSSGSSATETGFSQTTKSSDDRSSSSSSTASTTGAFQTKNAAANVQLGASSAGLFGLMLAAFAL